MSKYDIAIVVAVMLLLLIGRFTLRAIQSGAFDEPPRPPTETRKQLDAERQRATDEVDRQLREARPPENQRWTVYYWSLSEGAEPRLEPDISAAAVESLKGDLLITGKVGDWFKIQDGAGTIAWVQSEGLLRSKPRPGAPPWARELANYPVHP